MPNRQVFVSRRYNLIKKEYVFLKYKQTDMYRYSMNIHIIDENRRHTEISRENNLYMYEN